ncbi:MAG: hypothetical protein U0167_00265 [bacterium]
MAGGSRARLAALAGILAFVYFRCPLLLREPRFWAEEGSLYFATSWHASPLGALCQIHRGYLSLVPNVATLAGSRLVPLSWAPAVTELAALAAELVPLLLILWGRSILFSSFPARAIACAAVLLVGQTGEMWLASISAQFHLALATFLVLMEEPATTAARRAAHGAIVLVAGLTGVVSTFLLPLFIVRALRDRTRESAILAATLGLATIVQAAVVVATLRGSSLGYRASAGSIRGVVWVMARDGLLRPFAGPWLTAKIAALVPAGAWRAATAALALATTGLMIVPRADHPFAMGYAAFLLMLGLSTAASIRMAGGDRYAWAPALILVILTISRIERPLPGTRRSAIAILLLGAALLSWGFHLPRAASGYVDPAWTRWSDEVVRWDKNHAYRLRTWPQWPGPMGWGWGMKLSPTPGTPPSATRRGGS